MVVCFWKWLKRTKKHFPSQMQCICLDLAKATRDFIKLLLLLVLFLLFFLLSFRLLPIIVVGLHFNANSYSYCCCFLFIGLFVCLRFHGYETDFPLLCVGRSICIYQWNFRGDFMKFSLWLTISACFGIYVRCGSFLLYSARSHQMAFGRDIRFKWKWIYMVYGGLMVIAFVDTIQDRNDCIRYTVQNFNGMPITVDICEQLF